MIIMETPLVSVVVITYNSSKYILECLDSIYKQTYQNIELIITDDCSKDDTVEICRRWLLENKERFVRTELITVEKNTGTSANCNRGIIVSSGDWIKLIAGDDKLLPDCISDNVQFVNINDDANIVFSKIEPMGCIMDGFNISNYNPGPLFRALSHRQIRIVLCERNFLPAPTSFMRKSVWSDLNGYNEDIPFIEDWPMWMKATQMGCKLSFLDKTTVAYRFSVDSISQTNTKNIYIEDKRKVLSLGQYYLRRMNKGAKFLCYTLSHVKKNKLFRLLHFINAVNPFYYEYMLANKKYRNVVFSLDRNIIKQT